MTPEWKKNILIIYNLHQEQWYEDDDSVLSDLPITSIDVLCLCAKHWSQLSEYARQQWGNRASFVNQLPILGVFTNIPPLVMPLQIIRSLTQEFDRSVKTFHNILKIKQTIKDDQTMCCKQIRNEVVVLYTKVCRSLYMSHLL